MLPTGHDSSQTLGNILVALACFSRAMALEEGLRILTRSPLGSKQLQDVVEKIQGKSIPAVQLKQKENKRATVAPP